MANRITNREAIAQVKGLFREINADSTLTNKQVYSLIKKHSFWITKRESERLKLLRMDSFFQTLNCVDIVPSPIGDDCCKLKGKLDCIIYRTKNKIPEAYESVYGPIFKSITTIDGSISIGLKTAQEIKRLLNNRYAKKYKSSTDIMCYYSDGYLYFPDKHYKVIKIEGLFLEELDEKYNQDCSICKDCVTDDCKRFLDKQFMMSDYLWGQVIDAVIKELSIRERMPDKSETIDKNDNK